ncbi:MAG: MFS transporter [Firmicutes bacterium]|nr:MFS transporter [Bacillota bacterium]
MTRWAEIRSVTRLPAFGLLAASTAWLGLTVSFTRPYIPLYATRVLKMTPLELGAFMAATSLGSVALGAALGKLSDTRWPRKPILLGATLSAMAGYFGYLVLRSYGLLVLASGVFFGLAGAIFPQLFAYARDRVADFPPDTATRYTTVLRAIFSLAWVVGPLVGAELLALAGFRGLITSTIMAYGGLALIIGLGFRSDVVPRAPLPRDGPRPARIGAYPRGTFLAAAALTGFFVTNTMYSIALPLFVENLLKGTPREVGLLFAVSALAEVPLMLGLPWLANAVGPTALLRGAALLAAVYYGVVALSHGLVPILFVQAVYAATVAVFMSVGMSWFQERGPGAAGQMTTLYANTTYLGSLGGSLGVGVIGEVAGLRGVFWAAMALALGATLLLWAVPRSRRSRVGSPTGIGR